MTASLRPPLSRLRENVCTPGSRMRDMGSLRFPINVQDANRMSFSHRVLVWTLLTDLSACTFLLLVESMLGFARIKVFLET